MKTVQIGMDAALTTHIARDLGDK
jgi:hypothetical protein